MTTLAVQLAADPKMRARARKGCVAAFLLPIVLISTLLIAVLDDDSADAFTGIPGVSCAPIGSSATQVGRWGPEQMTNAKVIVAVGTQQQIPPRGQLVALMAAMTESALRNLDYGDRDSRGLFQMRPSQGWGTVAQITDPVYASETFYRVLLAVPNWQGMAPGDAAQAVERSGFPDRYAKNETEAHQILGAVTGVTCAPPGGGTGGGGSSSGSTCQDYSLPSDPRAETVVKAALCQVGVRYAWGGGTANGPSAGTGVDVGVVGFDCSGLALYAWEKAGVTVPHQTQLIWAAFQPAITHPADVHPGDLILLSSNGKPGGIHHVGIYLGGGRVVHAPQSGDVVKVTEGIWQNSYWSGEFIGAVRPGR